MTGDISIYSISCVIFLWERHRIAKSTRSSAVAKKSRDASCLYSFNTKGRAQSFIISCFGFRYTTAYNTRITLPQEFNGTNFEPLGPP